MRNGTPLMSPIELLEAAQQDLLTLARLAAVEGRLDEAEQLLDGADAADVPVRLTRLAIAAARERHVEAAQGYRQLLSEVEDLPEAVFGLASSLAYQGLYEQAQPYFERLVQLMPEQGRFHYHLGRNLLELEQPGEALESLAHSLELDPHNIDTYLVLSRTLSVAGQGQQAREVIELGLQILPEQPHLLNELANLQMLQGQLEAAALSARRVAEAHPENAAAQANSALALLAQRRFQEVIDFCSGQTHKSAALWALQAAALEELDQLEEASAAYEQAAQFGECDWETFNNWGLLLLRLGQDAEAEAALLRARRRAPLRPEPCLNLALVWARHPQGVAQALELLDEIVQRPRLGESIKDQAQRLERHLRECANAAGE